MEIKNYIHKFNIDDMEVELLVNKDPYWSAKVIKGNTGVGDCSGGRCDTIEEYIASMEREHRYAYNFFNKWYSHAKRELIK